MLQIQTGMNSLSWTLRYTQGVSTEPVAEKEAKTFLRQNSFVACTNCSLWIGNNQLKVSYNCTDGVTASFDLAGFDGQVKHAAMVIEQIAKVFDLSMFVDLATQSATETERASLQVRERAVADLAVTQQKLLDALAKISIEDVEHWRAREAEFDRDHNERKQRLDADNESKRAQNEQLLQNERRALDEARHQIEERERAADARDHRSARRKAHENLDTLLTDAKELAIDTATEGRRKRTEYSIWGMIVATAGLATLSGLFLFYMDSSFRWEHAIPFASSTFATWATLSYYIRWNDRWTREHADAEISRRRYRADAVRANWLAELVSEAYEQERGNPLPPELIAAFTRNLFADPVAGPETLHPLERLVDQAKELEVGKDGVRVKAGK